MTLELVFLGSGNAFAPKRYWSSFLLNDAYLFDAAPTVLPHLKMAGKALDKLKAVFLTHFHADHCLGLPFLFLEYAFHTQRKDDLVIVGPPQTEEVVETLCDLTLPGQRHLETGYQRRYVEVRDGFEGEVNGLRFQTRTLKHAEGLQAFGYRVEDGRQSLAYSGDTGMCDAIFDLAEGTDVFVLECSTQERTTPIHLCFEEIKEIRRRLSQKTKMILTHLDEQQDGGGLPNLLVAQDFATYRFE